MKKNTAARRIVSAILAAAAVLMLLCASGCTENVFSDYESDTFELGQQY